MNELKMTKEMMEHYKEHLFEQEKSQATIDKYLRDVKKFYDFLTDDKWIVKENLILFKNYLSETYKMSSANSMLAAVNNFLEFIGLASCRVKQFKIQKALFCRKEKELTRKEYERLVFAAKHKKNERISLVMQTICSTGIRVSEHRFITAEAIQEGLIRIYNKGKSRIVFLPPELAEILKAYCKDQKIVSGPVFITKSGKPLDRSNIWSMMKALCEEAGVDSEKVFPHNLRHLFAYTFYGIDKDLIRLADVLGHSSVDTTRIYTISSGWEHKQILSKLGLVLGYDRRKTT